MLTTSLRHSQNFIHSARLVKHLLGLTTISSEDTVYEIGPGKGQITAQLTACCRRVVAIEKDPNLYALLKVKFDGDPKVTLRNEDFLDYPLPRKGYKVFSNIPFDQTAAILEKLIEPTTAPEATYLIMQKEAAGRYAGEPTETLRSVLLKPWFNLSVLYAFQRSDFDPRPGVDAVLLRMQKRTRPLVTEQNRRLFRDFVVYAFTSAQPDFASTCKRIFSREQLLRLQRMISDFKLPSQVPFEIWLDLFAVIQKYPTRQGMARIIGSEDRLSAQQRTLKKIHRTRY
jgi:23S rRNA (adenine-N6)-dimethyltransferase